LVSEQIRKKKEEKKQNKGFDISKRKRMPSTGGVVDSTIISMRPIDVIPTSRQLSAGITTATSSVPDDREIFKVH
jgi:hypothetical protein